MEGDANYTVVGRNGEADETLETSVKKLSIKLNFELESEPPKLMSPSAFAEWKVYQYVQGYYKGREVQISCSFRYVDRRRYCDSLEQAELATPSKGELDIVVFDPKKGIIIIEVKSNRKGDLKKAASQVEYGGKYFKNLINIVDGTLRREEKIQQAIKKSKIQKKKHVSHSVEVCVAVPNRKFPQSSPQCLAKEKIFAQEQFESQQAFNSAWEKLLTPMVPYWNSDTESKHYMKELFADCHYRKSDFHDGRLLLLTPMQLMIATQSWLHRVIIKGAPGTGKTPMLTLKAQQLFKEEHKCLFICKNEPIYTKLCRSFQDADQFVHVLMADELSRLIQTKNFPPELYSGIFIDEGQETISIIRKQISFDMFMEKFWDKLGPFWIGWDSSQTYPPPLTRDDFLENLPKGFVIKELDTVLRSADVVTNATNSWISKGTPEKRKPNNFAIGKSKFFHMDELPYPPPTEDVACSQLEVLLDKYPDCLKSNNFALLVRSVNIRIRVIEKLEKNKKFKDFKFVTATDWASCSDEKWKATPNKIVVDSIIRFQGLDMKYVHVLDLGKSSYNSENEYRLMQYKGTSRCRSYIIQGNGYNPRQQFKTDLPV